MPEFLHANNQADAVVFGLEIQLSENSYNVGTGKDITIRELAETIQESVGHTGQIEWDDSKPD